jgi:hypothetical protein
MNLNPTMRNQLSPSPALTPDVATKLSTAAAVPWPLTKKNYAT